MTDPGRHMITLTVTDGEFVKVVRTGITITTDVVEPPEEDPDPEVEEPLNIAMLAGIVAVLVILGVAFYVMTLKRRTEEQETADEEEYKREHMERAYEAVKAAADKMEAELGGEPAEPTSEPKAEAEWVETRDEGLTMQARETEAASKQTMALFGAAKAAEPVMSEEEAEQLRLDNLKRKYQNAIGRLPYGIPSKKLADRDWVDLANALATGEKRTTPGGREITEIDGRWYYSSHEDMGTFLKEHGAKKEERKETEPGKSVEVTTDKEVLLAKLEERFILGEISEAAYKTLREKYEK
jgi:hypothetical protein